MSKKQQEPNYYELYSNAPKSNFRVNSSDYYLYGGHFSVKVKNGDISKALKIFRQKTKKSRLKELQHEYSYYEKPSIQKKNRIKRAKAIQKLEQKKKNKDSENLSDSGLWF